MNIKKNCFIVGIFSVLNTIQFLLFEVNYVTEFGYKSDMFSVFKETHLDHDSWFIMYIKSIKICLSAITLIVSCTFIYCVYMNICLGMLIYVIWLIIYDAVNLSMVLLIRESIKKLFEELSYLHLIFQISHMFLHFCCLPFVIKQIIILYKNPKLSNKTGCHRHSSISIADSWSPIQLALYRKFN